VEHGDASACKPIVGEVVRPLFGSRVLAIEGIVESVQNRHDFPFDLLSIDGCLGASADGESTQQHLGSRN